MTLSTEEAAAWFNSSASRMQQKVGTGVLPVEPLHLGRRLRWPTVQVLEALGVPFEIVTDAASPLPEGAEVHDLAPVPGSHPWRR